MDILVSVIVPVYKVEPFLQKCVDSIIDQTYTSIEIILIDDGSPDRCGQMCDQMAGLDDRIRVIHQSNKGLAETRNHGVEICKGQYILFADSDDYIEPNAVECLLKASLDTDADAVCCGYYQENGYTVEEHQLIDTVKSYEDEDIAIASMSGVFAPFAWNKLWKRELFNEGNKFPPGRYFEDLSTTWKLFNQCHRVTCVPDVLFHYLIRREGISNTKNMKNLVDHWLAIKERYDEMAVKGDALQQICMKECLESIAYTWRWLYGADKKERAEHEKELQDMRTFLKVNSDMVGLCPATTRISLFCVSHANPVTEAGCYYLNRIYRKAHGMDQMV